MGSSANFFYPEAVAVDGAGSIYVSDEKNYTVRKSKPVGTNWLVSTIGGMAGLLGNADGTNSAARFQMPQGVAVDSQGNVYVADYFGQTIRRGTPLPAPIPMLSITAAGSSILLSWPLWASNFIPEKTASLSPGSAWEAVEGSTVVSSNTLGLKTTATASKAFYRLHSSD